MKLNQGLPFDNRGETKQIVVFEKKRGGRKLLVDYLKILPSNKAQSYWKKQSIFKCEEKNHSLSAPCKLPAGGWQPDAKNRGKKSKSAPFIGNRVISWRLPGNKWMHSIIDRFFPICYGTSNENYTTVLSQSNLTLCAGDKERFFVEPSRPFFSYRKVEIVFCFPSGKWNRAMIKLFSLKQQKKEGEGAKGGAKRASAAQLRITKGAAWFGFRA